MTQTDTQSSGMGSKEFTVLVALLMSIVAISIDALLPALGVIGSDLAATSVNQPQLLIGLIFLGMAIGQLVAGPLSDALGRKPVLFSGFTLYLLGTIYCYLAPSLSELMIGRFIQGMGVAGPYITAISLVRDMYSGAKMARTMSLVMMIFIMVPAIAPSLGQGIMFISDWRGIFVMYLIYASLLIMWILLRLKETLPKEHRIPMTQKGFIAGFKEVLSNRQTRCYMICMGLFFGSFMGYLNSSQQIFQIQFETGTMFSAYFGLLALVFGISSLINSRIVEQYGMRFIALWAISIVITGSIGFWVLHSVVTITLWMFLIYASVIFFCFGMLFGNVNALAMEPMGHVAGIASAVIGSVSSILAIGIGTLIGQMYDNTLIPITMGFSVFTSIALVVMLLDGSKKLKDCDYNTEAT